MCSSDGFVVNEDDESLAIFLCNRGFDVWLGNNRGNKYGIKHVNPHLKNTEFWDFSFQEMAEYDLPAMLKFVTKKTKRDKLTYVGYS